MTYIPSEIVEKLHAIDIEDVAQRLGIKVSKHKAKCFMHDDHSPSLSFKPSKRMWKCFVCNKGGGTINLVMEYCKVSFIEACEWLCHQYGIYFNGQRKNRGIPILKRYTRNKELSTPFLFDREIGEWIINNANLTDAARNFLFGERKLKENVIRNINIKAIDNAGDLKEALVKTFGLDRLVSSGFIKVSGSNAYLRFFTPCLIFPYRDVKGDLVGIQTRFLGTRTDAPRFQFLAGFKPDLFNGQIINSLKKGDSIVISEGVTDCLALLSAGYNAIAIPSASNLPLSALKMLIDFRLFMSVDRDTAGQCAYRDLQYNIIREGGALRRFEFPIEYKDYGEYYKSTH